MVSNSYVLFAQDNLAEGTNGLLKMDFQIRPRAEFRNGVFSPILVNDEPAKFVSQRNRLGFGYSKNKQFETYINLQILNVWGNDPQVQQTANTVSLFEAWARINLTKNIELKAGRQILSYDDERILGALDWNNAGRKHDALLLHIEKNKIVADIAVAYNQNAEQVNGTYYSDSISQPYKSMQFAWVKYNINESLSISGIALNLCKQNRSDSTLNYQQTGGLNAVYNKNKIAAHATIYYQMGESKISNKYKQTSDGWMAALYGTYSVSKKVAIGIGSDYLSGTSMGSTRNTAFNPLYGTHHKFYGYMDYFYVASPHKNTGLWDSYFSAGLKAKGKTSYEIAFHHFVSPVNLVSNTGSTISQYLGNEIDLTFNHTINKYVKLVGGYSQMFASESLESIKGINSTQNVNAYQSWVWLSLIVNPHITVKL